MLDQLVRLDNDDWLKLLSCGLVGARFRSSKAKLVVRLEGTTFVSV